MPTPLDERVAAASGHPPLSEMTDAGRGELAALLETALELEDLPGKWQAALVRAELEAQARRAPRGAALSLAYVSGSADGRGSLVEVAPSGGCGCSCCSPNASPGSVGARGSSRRS